MTMYQVGEVVLCEWQGWLKAFRVVRVYPIDAQSVEYTLTMVEREDSPGWITPV